VSEQSAVRELWDSLLDRERLARQTRARQTKLRLLGLLFLFDALLIAAVLLSFQETELAEEVIRLEQTREVFSTVIIQEIITHTTVITEIVPYGSVQ
jgi:hypothetical protein